MKNKILAFIDLETTGLLLEKHEIIQIGLLLARQERENGKPVLVVVEELELNVIPEHLERADPEALKINGFTPEKWEDAIPLKTALGIIQEKCVDAVPVGHNISFDAMFLTRAFEKTGLKDPFDYHRLDTIPMAFIKLYDKPDATKFSLRALCAYFGVENKDAHTALSDVRATFQVFAKLLEAEVRFERKLFT